VAAGLASASVCSAEIVVLASGRTLSVASHRFDGGQVVLTLRAGGEIACDRALVSRIDPDEVPYPEPELAAASVPPAILDGPYRETILQAAERHGLDSRLLESVIRVESNFAHRARSRKGAMGLMQLMPGTARQYSLADPYDAAGNIDAGARHLRRLLNRFELPVALAAYNAGEGAVERYGGVPPYRETRAYVARVLRLVDRPAALAPR
jgi:soluble lytic murein transglycosylase-like protein